MNRLAVIYRSSDTHHAFLLAHVLERYEITAHVVAEQAVEGPSLTEVYVAASDAEEGLGIARLFEKHIVAGNNSDSVFESLGNDLKNHRADSTFLGSSSLEGRSDTWGDWPQCPQCRVPRQTRCPVCETAGHQFRLGDLPEGMSAAQMAVSLVSESIALSANAELSATDAPVLVVCHTCDEPFHPRFYAQCASCGHRFRQGMECEPVESEAVSYVLTMAGIAVAATLVAGWWALSR